VEIAKLFNALPSAVSQGVIWGIMAIGVYITYRILDVADLTKLVRAYLAASSQENADVLHTVRASADATFDFYLPRGKETVELQGIEGEPVILFQTERGKKPGSYTVHRNGVLVVRR